MKNTLVVNLFSGPGAGKTSMMAGIFAELKWREIDCEIAPEFAKELVWDKSLHLLDNQFYVSAEQYQRVKRLYGKVDVIITDSPLLLGHVYDKDNDVILQQLLYNRFCEFNSANYVITRFKRYNKNGRVQTEEQAKEIDYKISNLLNTYNIQYTTIDGNRESTVIVADQICKLIKKGE